MCNFDSQSQVSKPQVGNHCSSSTNSVNMGFNLLTGGKKKLKLKILYF